MQWWQLVGLVAVAKVSCDALSRASAAMLPAASLAEPGPLAWLDLRDRLKVSCGGRDMTLGVTVVYPDASDAKGAWQPPYPLVVFYGGFQARTSHYALYAHHLASWGFCVVSYNLPLFRIVEDAAEVTFLDPLLTWIEDHSSRTGGPLAGLVDTSRLAACGHSRGAKLAALQLVGHPRVAAAYLIDPVDNTRHTPESAAYPSALRALRVSRARVAISGAGVSGPCNPAGSNYEDFYEAAGPGSWLAVVVGAGHTAFMDAGPLLNRLVDCLCHRGWRSHKETIELTVPPLILWLQHELGLDPSNEHAASGALLPDAAAWATAEQAAGRLVFSAKPRAAEPEHPANGSNILPLRRQAAQHANSAAGLRQE